MKNGAGFVLFQWRDDTDPSKGAMIVNGLLHKCLKLLDFLLSTGGALFRLQWVTRYAPKATKGH